MSADNEKYEAPKPPAIPSAGSKIEREDCFRGLGLDGWKPTEVARPGSPADDYNTDIFGKRDDDGDESY